LLLVPLSTASCALVYPLDGLTGGDAGGGADAHAAGDSHGLMPAEGGGPNTDAGGGKDATIDSGCGGKMLCPCANSQGCTEGFCGDEVALSPALFAAAGNTNICTRPCCTSADCSGSTVCFATGAGGNYCVNPAWLGRGATGARVGGATCVHDGDCRSGLCSGGACADTCCSWNYSPTQCTSGTSCVFGYFPGRGFDTHFAAYCTASTGMPYDTPCSDSSQCAGGLCYNDTQSSACTIPCESNADCMGDACDWDQIGNDWVAHCYLANGNGDLGAPCSSPQNCMNDYCNPESQCTTTCFKDSDCQSNGWTCRPDYVTFAMSTTTYEILFCGP
jgi:hypothetical protein